MEFFRPEYWSGQPFPSPGDLPDPGIKLGCPALQADYIAAELQGKPHDKFYKKKPRQSIKKQRHHFASQGPYTQSYVFFFCFFFFPGSHVWM